MHDPRIDEPGQSHPQEPTFDQAPGRSGDPDGAVTDRQAQPWVDATAEPPAPSASEAGASAKRPADGVFPGVGNEPASDPRQTRLAHRAHLAERPLIEGRRFNGWPGLIGVLVAGLRALTMLPVRPGEIPARALWTMVLAVSIILVAIVGDALILGEGAAEFNWNTLRASGLDLALLVLSSVWLAEPRPRPATVAAPQSRPAALPVPALQSVPAAQPGPASRPVPASQAAPTLREPPPPLHLATVVLAASFWTVVAGYGVTIILDRQVQAGLDAWVPGLWFYAWFMIWPWWVAIRTIQYQHRYQPIPWWRRAVVILLLLTAILWALSDPGEPFWIYSEPEEPDQLYTVGQAALTA